MARRLRIDFRVASLLTALMLPTGSLLGAEMGMASRPGHDITFGGEIGAAESALMRRFSERPYQWLNWLRADLTGEKNPQFDKKWGHPMNRPFKEYSGDISGRYIEIMSIAQSGTGKPSPILSELIAEALKNQRKDGYFCASGEVDWSRPLNTKDGRKILQPALWGNGRILCGLIEASRAFKDPAVLASAKKLGDFYVRTCSRFTDKSRIKEFMHGDTYAASFVTCYFPAMEGLVKLYRITKEKKYLDTAAAMAEFYKTFDRLPIDHAHGMLCCQVSLLLLYEETKNKDYLQRVEKRWTELVDGGYINPLGATGEKCHIRVKRDEGCAIADWLRLNLALGAVVGKAKYWAMTERVLHNHFLQNQSRKGGFGHRLLEADDGGVTKFKGDIEESTWCCTYHGKLALLNLRKHLFAGAENTLTFNFALDFTYSGVAEKIVSKISPAEKPGKIMRQQITVNGPKRILEVRIPHWADSVSITEQDGKAMGSRTHNGFCSTEKKVSSATFMFAGGVFAENRRCSRLPDGPVAGKACTLWYGPKLLVGVGSSPTIPKEWPLSLDELKKRGMVPLTAEMREKDFFLLCRPEK